MSQTKMAPAPYAAFLVGVILASSSATAIDIRPGMQTVVTCVYDVVRSKPGVLSIAVYTVGAEKYVVEYKFREKGQIFTGGIGIHDFILNDGKHLYTNDTPRRQPDHHGMVELNFLGTQTIRRMYEKCNLAPGFDDTIRLQGDPEPQWQKVDMPRSSN